MVGSNPKSHYDQHKYAIKHLFNNLGVSDATGKACTILLSRNLELWLLVPVSAAPKGTEAGGTEVGRGWGPGREQWRRPPPYPNPFPRTKSPTWGFYTSSIPELETVWSEALLYQLWIGPGCETENANLSKKFPSLTEANLTNFNKSRTYISLNC